MVQLLNKRSGSPFGMLPHPFCLIIRGEKKTERNQCTLFTGLQQVTYNSYLKFHLRPTQNYIEKNTDLRGND